MPVSPYNPARDITPAFLDQVADWIATDGEVFAVLRWVGGHRDYALCRSRAEFERLTEIVCDGTEVIAMRGRHLSVRGPVTEELIARAREAVPDGADYLVISAATKPGSRVVARVAGGESHRELEEDLRDWMGVEVAVGVCPDFWVADHERLISRAKGGVEGPR